MDRVRLPAGSSYCLMQGQRVHGYGFAPLRAVLSGNAEIACRGFGYPVIPAPPIGFGGSGAVWDLPCLNC